MAALVLVASNGHKWAGWLFAVVILLGVFVTIGEVWASAPSWVRLGEPFEKLTTLDVTLDVIAVLGVTAVFVYFTGDARTTIA